MSLLRRYVSNVVEFALAMLFMTGVFGVCAVALGVLMAPAIYWEVTTAVSGLPDLSTTQFAIQVVWLLVVFPLIAAALETLADSSGGDGR